MKKISQSESGFTIYHNHRDEPYFTFVKNGQKTIEGRINKGEYRFLKIGDHIVVSNKEETDSVEIIVKDLHLYASFREMLEKENFKKVLPEAEDIDQGVEVYNIFYTDEQQKEFGVVAILFEKK